MVTIFLWSLISYGMSTILVYGSIFETLRESIHKWGKSEFYMFQGVGKFLSGLISCMLCTSTWVGFFLSITIGGLTQQYLGTHWFISIFFDGMFTAGSVWTINAIVEFFEENRFMK